MVFAAPNAMRDCTRALFVALILSAVTLPSRPARAITLNGAFDGSQPIMPMRLDRDGVDATCAMPKAFPGSTETPTQYEVFEFCNNGPEQCITVDFDVGTCDHDVHLIGYVGAFDPQNLSANYAGDSGKSESGTFSFTVPSKQHLFIVAQANFAGTNCRFSFLTNALPCIQPAPVPSDWSGWLLVAGLAIVGLAGARRLRRGVRA